MDAADINYKTKVTNSLYQQSGTVMQLDISKLVLEFNLNRVPKRALLQIKNFVNDVSLHNQILF